MKGHYKVHNQHHLGKYLGVLRAAVIYLCGTQIENYPFRSEIELNIDFDTGMSPALNSNAHTNLD